MARVSFCVVFIKKSKKRKRKKIPKHLKRVAHKNGYKISRQKIKKSYICQGMHKGKNVLRKK